MRSWARVIALALALGACSAADPLTELVVVVDTDLRVPDELDTVRIVVGDGQGTVREATADLASGAPRPVTLGLVSRTTLGPLEIEARGERGGALVVRRFARVSFVEGRTMAISMNLLAGCATTTCDAEQTCGESGCRAIDVGPEELSEWTGAPSGDGGIGREDAGPDDDAGMTDGGTIECSGPEECDDAVACTTDECSGGTCAHTPDALACDDAVACTVDACDPVAGCTNTPDASACDDGIACTVDSCEPLVGCRSTPVHSMCDAGSYCDPSSGCTTAPTFTEIYTGILAARCGPCHTSAGTRGGDLDLATQTQAYLQLVGVTGVCGGGTNVRVIPGDAARSLLWRKLSGVDLCGDLMPRASMQLGAAQIAQVAQWINAGALE